MQKFDPAASTATPDTGQSTSPPPMQIDPGRAERLIAQMRTEQSLLMAVVGGLLGAAGGAAIWAAVTVTTNFQIGYMAIGVGFLVGVLVRSLGKGVDPVFGFVGATLALLGCVAGNLLSGCGFLAAEEGVSFFTVIGSLTPDLAIVILKVMFEPIDLLFYGIAVYEGYRFSFRRITEEEIASLVSEPAQSPLRAAA